MQVSRTIVHDLYYCSLFFLFLFDLIFRCSVIMDIHCVQLVKPECTTVALLVDRNLETFGV